MSAIHGRRVTALYYATHDGQTRRWLKIECLAPQDAVVTPPPAEPTAASVVILIVAATGARVDQSHRAKADQDHNAYLCKTIPATAPALAVAFGCAVEKTQSSH